MSTDRNVLILRKLAECLINEGYHLTCTTRNAVGVQSLNNCREAEAVVQWFTSVSSAMIHVRRTHRTKYPDGWVSVEFDSEHAGVLLLHSQLLANCVAPAVEMVAQIYGVTP